MSLKIQLSKFYIQNSSLDKFILFYTFIEFILALCPAPEILNPCKCDANGISCGGNDWINLKNIFKANDQKLNESEKHFKKFYLNNTAITELEENTFYEITFDEIHIYNVTKLKFINSNAFNGTKTVTKGFHINHGLSIFNTALINSPPTHDIFYMLSSFINLETIYLCFTNITNIPSHAFRSVNGIQDKLSVIVIDTNPIVEIGDNAFSALNNLILLDFFSTAFQSISKTCFFFEKDSNKNLKLNLVGSNLNGSSLAIGLLNSLKRPTTLDLSFNSKLTYLDQRIFQPFLKSNVENKIIIDSDQQLDCDDCRTYWLKKEPKYLNRTQFGLCSNNRKFIDKSNFAKCVDFF